jgi:diguanylate cyclase (GGDEF)-like protein
VGDEALRAVARIVASHVRASDSVYRYGGEEILILLPQQSTESAYVAVERLRQAVEAAQIHHPDNTPFGVVTVSIGVASIQGDGEQSSADVLRLADEALYEAKRLGRNRIELSASARTTA